MMMRTMASAIAPWLLLLGVGVPQAAQDVGRETLAGLAGVRVFVEEIAPEAERDGVTTSNVQTQVELILRRAQIRVLDLDAWNSSPGKPMVRIALAATKNQLSTYGYNLDVQLLQSVVLFREPSISTYSVTWLAPNVVHLVNASGLRNAVRQDVEDKVEAFVNAYFAANRR